MSKMSKNESLANRLPLAQKPHYGVRAWLVGLLLLLGFIVLAANLGEVEHFIALARQLQPVWLVTAVFAQILTYFCAAAIWQQTLRHAGVTYSLWQLLPLGFAKLFSDQALPSGGLSGTAFFVTALNRRGVDAPLCMAALLVSLITYYIAFLLVALTSLALLWLHHAIQLWIVGVGVLFCLVVVAIPGGLLWLHRVGNRQPPQLLLRLPGVGQTLQAFTTTPSHLMLDRKLMQTAVFLQLAIFLLDSVTLWIMLLAIGQDTTFLVAFPSFVVGAMVGLIGLIPMGLGTFEATCVAILHLLGTPVEAALTATLLLRGLTLWLPMLPGLWYARRELN